MANHNPSPSALANHIKSLCRKYGVHWNVIHAKRPTMLNQPLWASSTASSADTPQRINTPMIEGGDFLKIFAAALHELGHCIEFNTLSYDEQCADIKKTLAAHGYTRPVSLYLLTKEFIAWDIAKVIAGPLWNPTLSKFKYSVLSYWIKNYNKHHKRKKSVKNFPRQFFFGTHLPHPKSPVTKNP